MSHNVFTIRRHMAGEPVPLLEAFKSRHSVRTFAGAFDEERQAFVQKVVDEVNALETPFGTETRVGMRGPGLGRMGVIKNEAGWLTGEIKDGEPKDRFKLAQIDVSYRLQIAAMKFQQNHIGFVWIGGTFNEGKSEGSCPGWKVPITVAYGEERPPHFMSKFSSWLGGSKKRKAYQDLFFDLQAGTPITEANAGERFPIYEALRSGPSALNQQGWRFIVDGPLIHLFDAIDNSYSACDDGIAIANLVLLGKEAGKGTFRVVDPAPAQTPLKGKYICSVEIA